jgi:hypothetical protein
MTQAKKDRNIVVIELKSLIIPENKTVENVRKVVLYLLILYCLL